MHHFWLRTMPGLVCKALSSTGAQACGAGRLAQLRSGVGLAGLGGESSQLDDEAEHDEALCGEKENDDRDEPDVEDQDPADGEAR